MRRTIEKYPCPAFTNKFGAIDIYLFDQLSRGRIALVRALDAGCGTGSNLVYLLREGYEDLRHRNPDVAV